jgi:hypothetical protein
LQTKLAVNQPGDRFEQEADRVADFVVQGGKQTPSLSKYSLGLLQRDEQKTPPKPDNYDEAISKILDALKETPVAKDLQAKAAELGKDFVSSVEGKVITGSALGGALAAIIATNSKLPMQIPELPLDFIAPGLKAKITWEGPSQSPTNAGLVLTTKSGVSVGASYTKTPASGGKPAEEKAGLTLTVPLGGSSEKKKGGPTASEKYRAETAKIAADQEKFRAGMKTPGEKKDDQDFVDSYVRSKVDPTKPLGLAPLKKKEDLLLMRKVPNESTAAPTSAPPIVNDVLQSSGEPIQADTRRFFEERFGYDFAHVRVHTDARAAESAQAVRAHAYTVGEHIAFAPDRYAPETVAGQKLLAHELTHVIQQGSLSEGHLLQRAAVEYVEQVDDTDPTAAQILSKFDQSVTSVEKNVQSQSGPQMTDLNAAAAQLKSLRTGGKVAVWRMKTTPPVFATFHAGSGQLRLNYSYPDAATAENTLVHEAIHAVHAARNPEISAAYGKGLASGIPATDTATVALLHKWKAWTEYWAYRRAAEYSAGAGLAQDPDMGHRVAIANPDVRASVMAARADDPNFDPKTWQPTAADKATAVRFTGKSAATAKP